jgi:hypothetical protein
VHVHTWVCGVARVSERTGVRQRRLAGRPDRGNTRNCGKHGEIPERPTARRQQVHQAYVPERLNRARAPVRLGTRWWHEDALLDGKRNRVERR